MTQLDKMRVFLHVLMLMVILEAGFALAETDEPAKVITKATKSTTGLKGKPKIRRTVRLHESVPAEPASSPESLITGPNVDVTNSGANNHVDVNVKPEITIPQAEKPADIKSTNSKLSTVPYRARKFHPRNTPQVAAEGASKGAQVEDNPGDEAFFLRRNAGNSVLMADDNNDNTKNVVRKNSGNSETVIIDGADNQKTVKLTNSGARDETSDERPERSEVQATSGRVASWLADRTKIEQVSRGPLVQINMGDLVARAQEPQVRSGPQEEGRLQAAQQALPAMIVPIVEEARIVRDKLHPSGTLVWDKKVPTQPQRYALLQQPASSVGTPFVASPLMWSPPTPMSQPMVSITPPVMQSAGLWPNLAGHPVTQMAIPASLPPLMMQAPLAAWPYFYPQAGQVSPSSLWMGQPKPGLLKYITDKAKEYPTKPSGKEAGPKRDKITSLEEPSIRKQEAKEKLGDSFEPLPEVPGDNFKTAAPVKPDEEIEWETIRVPKRKVKEPQVASVDSQ